MPTRRRTPFNRVIGMVPLTRGLVKDGLIKDSLGFFFAGQFHQDCLKVLFANLHSNRGHSEKVHFKRGELSIGSDHFGKIREEFSPFVDRWWDRQLHIRRFFLFDDRSKLVVGYTPRSSTPLQQNSLFRGKGSICQSEKDHTPELVSSFHG